MLRLTEKSSLTHIDAATLAAIAKIKNGTLPNMRVRQANQASVVYVSGMPVKDKQAEILAKDKSLQELTADTEAYENDQALLSEKLAKASVKALAFLPTESWWKIQRDSGLYTFHNENGNGTVNTSLRADTFADDVARKVARKVESSYESGWPITISLIIAVVSQYFIMDKVFPVLGWGFIFSWVAGTVASFFTLSYLFDITINSLRLALWKEIRSEGGILNMLWPNKTEPSNKDRSGLKVKVKFPEAPEDVNQTLLAIYRAGIKTMLTTDKSAICLETDVFALLLSKTNSEYKNIKDFERELAARIKADPIIWTQEGKCVAIIAQYGDFPIEKQVIDKVLKENFMI